MKAILFLLLAVLGLASAQGWGFNSFYGGSQCQAPYYFYASPYNGPCPPQSQCDNNPGDIYGGNSRQAFCSPQKEIPSNLAMGGVIGVRASYAAGSCNANMTTVTFRQFSSCEDYARFVQVPVGQCISYTASSTSYQHFCGSIDEVAAQAGFSIGSGARPTARCQVKITTTKRTGDGSSWDNNGHHYQVYDMSVQNIGTCAVKSVELKSYYFLTSWASSSWGYEQTGSHKLNLWGNSFAAGSSWGGYGAVLQDIPQGIDPTSDVYGVANCDC